jgi:hypothetical protein
MSKSVPAWIPAVSYRLQMALSFYNYKFLGFLEDEKVNHIRGFEAWLWAAIPSISILWKTAISVPVADKKSQMELVDSPSSSSYVPVRRKCGWWKPGPLSGGCIFDPKFRQYCYSLFKIWSASWSAKFFTMWSWNMTPPNKRPKEFWDTIRPVPCRWEAADYKKRTALRSE